jgi:hypothetical protein
MKSVVVEEGFSLQRVTTRAEIQKTIVEGMVHIKKHYGDNCTIKDLLKEREKIEKKSTMGLSIPFYCVYPLIMGQALKKRDTLLKDIIDMYEYAYHCDFDFVGFNTKYKPRLSELGDKSLTIEEIMNTKVDLNILLNGEFAKEYGTYLFCEQDFGRRHTQEEYLEFEEKAIEIESKKQEEKNTKKVGRR